MDISGDCTGFMNSIIIAEKSPQMQIVPSDFKTFTVDYAQTLESTLVNIPESINLLTSDLTAFFSLTATVLALQNTGTGSA